MQGFELRAVFRQGDAHLGRIIVFVDIEIEHMLDLDQREAQPLATQDEFQSRPIARGIDTRLTATFRINQTLVFVKSQRPCGYVKFFRQLANGKGFKHVLGHGALEKRGEIHDRRVLPYAYVNVKINDISPEVKSCYRRARNIDSNLLKDSHMKTTSMGRTGPKLAQLGLGCMGMSAFYGHTAESPEDRATAIKVIHHALDHGVDMLDTADMYGPYHNEILVGEAIQDRRDRVFLATKFAIRMNEAGERYIDNDPAYIREACDASLKRLGVDHIDLYYMHRRNPATPIEDSVGAMADLVKAGKVRHIGLSEVSGDTLRRAYAVHPIAAVQSEYSLWTRDVETGILPVCRDLGVALVAYSPLGRGFLSGTITKPDAELASNDFRRFNPRFSGEALDQNLKLVETLKRLAEAQGVSASQLALAWVLEQGEDIFAIPGTRRIAYLDQNLAAAALRLSPETRAALLAAFPPGVAQGARYPEATMSSLDQ